VVRCLHLVNFSCCGWIGTTKDRN